MFVVHLPMIKQQANQEKKEGKGKKAQSAESVELQSRRPREPNWEHAKVLALVKAKKKEHLAYLDRVNGQDQFETVMSKWKKSQNLS
jgi:hypothetical protein